MKIWSEVKIIDLRDIVEPALFVRSGLNEEAFDELVSSIKILGVIEPIIVNYNQKKYQIVAGYRRWMASKMANKIDIPCLLMEGTEEEILSVMLQENGKREDLNPVDEGRLFSRLRREKGMQLKQMADLCGKTETHVSQRIQLVEGDEVILAAVERGELTVTVARELQKINDVSERRRLAGYAVVSGVTEAQAKAWRQSVESQAAAQEPLNSSGGIGTIQPLVFETRLECSCCKKMVLLENTVVVRYCSSCQDKISEAIALST